jgi:predicted metalloprotease
VSVRARILVAVCTAVVAAVAVTACGGDAEPARTATTVTTQAAASDALQSMPDVAAGSQTIPRPASPKRHDAALLRTAFASAQSMWREEFAAASVPWADARVHLFEGTVETACGPGSAASGPFYCPADHGVYLSTRFFDALARTYGLSSGFAAGYIVAHEVGHHIQQLLGIHRRVAIANTQDPEGANGRSVRVELQADCFAGIWLHAVSHAGQLDELDVGDILRAAAVVGDDFRRMRAGAEPAPETWTHGSSRQRTAAVLLGLQSGAPSACDTLG